MRSSLRFFNPHSAILNLKLKRLLLTLTFSLICVGLLEANLEAMPPVQRTVLPNGLILLFSETLPALVTLQLLIDSGSRKDPSGEEGLSHLTARGLLLGTSKRTITAIHEELDFMGAILSSSSGRDYATLSLQVLKKDLDKGWDLFMETLTQPTFPDEEIHREVEKTLAAIQSAEDQPDEVAEKAFRKTLFLDSPYAHPVEGTKESLLRIKRDAILRFFRTYYHPNNAILTIVGDISADEIRTKLLPILTKWPMGEVSKMPFKPAFAEEAKTVKIDRGITQANIVLGHAGVSRDNPDYYALTVMNYILGSGGFLHDLWRKFGTRRGLPIL